MSVIAVKPLARREIASALSWWLENRTKNPKLLSLELRAAFKRLEISPGIGSPVDDEPAARRLLLVMTGWWIYYYYDKKANVVYVLRFWHGRREVEPDVEIP